MTFTEAALEVLRTANEPLHYKRITELAIERNLLSHVGKTPEVTMSSRLATMVKNDRGSAPIIKVKPGVFAIRADAKLDLEAIAAEAALEEAELLAEATGEEAQDSDAPAEKTVLPGADVFPEEEDDDDPILAGLDSDDSDNDSSDDRRGGRRRRRRRRGKGGDGDEASNGEPRMRDRDSGRERTRDRGHDSGSRDRRSGGDNNHEPRIDFSREPGDGDLLGKGLADAAWTVLSRAERNPATFARVADMLVARGRLSGQGAALAPTIAAALRADVAASERTGMRARFLLRQGRVYLTDWLLPNEMVRAEESASRNAERQRGEARRAFLARVNDLPTAGFAELLATWMNGEGVTSLRAVRRPGSSSGEFHFAGVRKRGPEEERLAIVVLRGGRDIDREMIIAVRGSLHHYGNATSAWIVSTGRISSGAREEIAAITPSQVTLFDGQELATAMERLGIGLRQRVVAVSEVDFDLIEALGGNLRLPEAREERAPREGGRERRRGRGRDRGSRSGEDTREEENAEAVAEPMETEEAAQTEDSSPPEAAASTESDSDRPNNNDGQPSDAASVESRDDGASDMDDDGDSTWAAQGAGGDSPVTSRGKGYSLSAVDDHEEEQDVDPRVGDEEE